MMNRSENEFIASWAEISVEEIQLLNVCIFHQFIVLHIKHCCSHRSPTWYLLAGWQLKRDGLRSAPQLVLQSTRFGVFPATSAHSHGHTSDCHVLCLEIAQSISTLESMDQRRAHHIQLILSWMDEFFMCSVLTTEHSRHFWFSIVHPSANSAATP